MLKNRLKMRIIRKSKIYNLYLRHLIIPFHHAHTAKKPDFNLGYTGDVFRCIGTRPRTSPKRKRVMKRTVLLFMTLLVIFSSCFYNEKRMSLPAMCTGRIRLRRLLCTLCFIDLTFTGSNDHPFTSFLISLPSSIRCAAAVCQALSRLSLKMVMLITPPSKIMYIQKYSQSMTRTMVVKLPYIVENPSKMSR